MASGQNDEPSEAQNIADDNQKALDTMAREGFAAGFETPDGTVLGLFRNILAAVEPPRMYDPETERLRAEYALLSEMAAELGWARDSEKGSLREQIVAEIRALQKSPAIQPPSVEAITMLRHIVNGDAVAYPTETYRALAADILRFVEGCK